MSELPLSPAAFATIAAELLAQPDPEVTAETVVKRLVEWLPDAGQVSLTERTSSGYRTVAATGRVAEQADLLQYELGEGPCTDAADQGGWIRSGEVADDPRWPTWGPRAGTLGVRSMLSVPLLASGRREGALNAYSDLPATFDDRDVIDLALVYAIHAANALSAAHTADDLHTALTSRHVIGMAQGIVMERFGLDQDRSFELLRRLSSTTNTKLRDVARSIVETKELPAPPADDA